MSEREPGGRPADLETMKIPDAGAIGGLAVAVGMIGVLAVLLLGIVVLTR